MGLRLFQIREIDDAINHDRKSSREWDATPCFTSIDIAHTFFHKHQFRQGIQLTSYAVDPTGTKPTGKYKDTLFP